MSDEYDFKKAKRGAVLPTPKGKTKITIRIDDDVLDWFRDAVHEAGGGNYQTLMNDALRQYVEGEQEVLEETLRRVIREELPQSSKATRKKKTRRKKKPRSRAKRKPRKKTGTRRKRA